eukprot:2073236-Prymnesium_polylepis.1
MEGEVVREAGAVGGERAALLLAALARADGSDDLAPNNRAAVSEQDVKVCIAVHWGGGGVSVGWRGTGGSVAIDDGDA